MTLGTRNHKFFNSLSGLKRGLDNVIDNTPSSATSKEDRSSADVQERQSKQAAKLARRAARNKTTESDK